MDYIDPHLHMVSRVTDDYVAIAQAGCVAVSEPAFWAGFDRSSAQGFYDYFEQLTRIEPRRAATYGIAHHCWLCINPKEAEDPAFAQEVIALIPSFLDRPTVLGIGEIGLNKNSRNELAVFEDQLALAADHDMLVLIHTPHLEDKLKGTRLTLDAIAANPRLKPERILIDHVEEHTIEMVLDRGFWAGITLYPYSKTTPQRAADMIEMYGSKLLCINSACDWGHSDPLAIPKTRAELLARGHSRDLVHQITYDNPKAFFEQSGRFHTTVPRP